MNKCPPKGWLAEQLAYAVEQTKDLPAWKKEYFKVNVNQYYYETTGCPAQTADSENCTCWHEEGTGIFEGETRDNPAECSSLRWRTKGKPVMAEITIAEAFNTLQREMAFDTEPGSYAHGWHCNLAMACYDAMHSAGYTDHYAVHKTANEAASRFMKNCFNVETKA